MSWSQQKGDEFESKAAPASRGRVDPSLKAASSTGMKTSSVGNQGTVTLLKKTKLSTAMARMSNSMQGTNPINLSGKTSKKIISPKLSKLTATLPSSKSTPSVPSTQEQKPPAQGSVVDTSAKKREIKKTQQAHQAALSRLLQPKTDVAVLSVDAHHSSAMLGMGFFKSPIPKNASQAAKPGQMTAYGVTNEPAVNSMSLDLLGLYKKDGTLKAIQKGRQRLGPQKKKFTPLKKKVLEERLRKWKELNPDEKRHSDSVNRDCHTSTSLSTTVCLLGLCEPDELEDDEEYEEIVANLRDMADKIGTTKYVFIPRAGDFSPGEWPSWVDFVPSSTANDNSSPAIMPNLVVEAAVASWDGLILGGQKLRCKILTALPLPDNVDGTSDDEAQWMERCMSIGSIDNVGSEVTDVPINVGEADSDLPLANIVLVDKALDEGDIDDVDCLIESLQDVKVIAEKFGSVVSLDIVPGVSPPRLRIVYRNDARDAVEHLNKQTIGGQTWCARIAAETSSIGDSGDFCVLLCNILSADDLEDEDCLAESLNDLQELAQRFGTVKSIGLDNCSSSVDKKAVRISFSSMGGANACATHFDGTVMGGMTVSANVGEAASSKVDEETHESSSQSNIVPATMLSGDKVIAERFAECKRVPKIVNQEAVRQYACISTDETIKPLLIEMLGELMRLQKRAVDDKNAKARRRVVMGLREVARGIRSHKVKMVVMANNLDEYGIIDKTLQEILDIARAEDVPVFFEFTKRALGKALGKSLKVAVAGVQNADGAHQQFKKLMNYASRI